VRFANSGNNTGSSFTYDGLGRVVRVVDTQGGVITADHSFLWCGMKRCVAHDNTQSGSPVSTQYFAQGLITGRAPYYYVKDRLGSVTQLITGSGSIAVQYAYDPYGNQSLISGTGVSDVGYAGYFSHAASGLGFTVHRAYDPGHARWLNRDPIGEGGGINLYAYVTGNPISLADPSGLYDLPPLEEFLGELAEATDVFGPIAVYAAPLAGAVATGIGLGLTIDYACATCEAAAESVGATIYEATHPYEPSPGINPNSLTSPASSSIDPFSIENSFPSPTNSSCSK
jgi:RHS repeat-associated protein